MIECSRKEFKRLEALGVLMVTDTKGNRHACINGIELVEINTYDDIKAEEQGSL